MSISGFACPSCNSQLLLSDVMVRQRIVKCFKDGAGSASIRCSGCGHEHTYSYHDLKVFPPPGRQGLPIDLIVSNLGSDKSPAN